MPLYIQSLRSLGHELLPERFDDQGYSGATLERPTLQRLIEAIRSGTIDQIVVYRLDQLSRNLRHFTTLFEEMAEHGVALEVVTAPSVGAVALDKLMLSILASFAEFERDLAASRIAEARAHLKAHGRRIAGAIPFGYAAERHTKQLIVCDEEADAVVRIFRWAAADVKPSVIATYANALRWTTGGGNPWTARQVLSILRNPVYAGLVVTRSGFGAGCHAPLVDREIYDVVQSLIEARRTGGPGRRPPSAGITWILRGLLHCALAGGR